MSAAQSTFDIVEPVLRLRSTFRYWTPERVRFSDTDKIGHVNNTSYAVYCETGRADFNSNILIRAARAALPGRDVGILVARVAINYRAESHYPEAIDIGTGVVRIGRTSIVLGQGLFVGERLIATSEGVVVLADSGTHVPIAVPDAMRAELADWQFAAAVAGLPA